MDEIIAIITARGGSKRIHRKNVKKFCGKPIIEYSIKAAQEANIFTEIMVSTDDQEIAEISKNAGAAVPFFRSKETSSDYATTADVLLEVLNKYKNRGKEFVYASCIYPTAPFISSEKLKKGYDIIRNNDAFQVTPVVAYSFPPQRGFVIREEKLEYISPQFRQVRSQDLESQYHDAGQFYFYRVDKLIESKGVIVENNFPLILSELEVQDIDTETDWKLAEMKYKIINDII